MTFDGPFARERDTRPNPFLDYRLTVRFTHESGAPSYDVPGYFAADGDAAVAQIEEDGVVTHGPVLRWNLPQ